MVKRMDSHVTMQKVIPNVDKKYRDLWKIPDDHQSVGLIACDVEEVMNFALDDASKKARIRILHTERINCGFRYTWTHYGGEITAVISGPRVEDVRSGLFYIREYVEHKCALYVIDGDDSMAYYADYIPRAGKYNQERLGLPADVSLAYLVASPLNATYALDQALKASDTRIVEFFEDLTRTNKGGAVLCGTEAACKSAVAAFSKAVEYCYAHPMDLDS